MKNLKKVLTVIIAAILFGAVAGGTIVGIYYLSGINNRLTEQAESGAAEEPKPEASSAPDIAMKNLPQVKVDSSKEAALLPDVSGIAEEAMPALVCITNTKVVKQQSYGSLFDFYFGGVTEREYEVPAAGSGVIMQETDDELLIVTNNHVVEDAKELLVQFIDDEEVTAAVKGTSPDVDIAVIAVKLSDIKEETKQKIKVAKLHDKEDIKPGQGVIAIGNSLGYGQTVTVGYVSALNRSINTEKGEQTDLIQTDAAINPGNSGGALLNAEGEVIGINVAKDAGQTVDSVGFSIPVYKVVDIIKNLASAKTKVAVEESKQGRLGVYLATVDAGQAEMFNMPEGILVTGFSDEVMEGSEDLGTAASPAKEGGMLKNDIIISFDGQPVKEAEQLTGLIKYYEAGTQVDITVKRLENGEYAEKVLKVTLGSVNDMPGMSQNKEPVDDGVTGRDEGRSFGFFKDNGEGEGGEDGSQSEQGSGNSGYDDVYDLFRQFMDQYR